MSEEVTGQLGDVIPGALSLMADAAGMSMAEFKDAMEDGQLSGDAMEQVFNNLAIVLDERFGKGAEGAAKTLQGAITNINNSLQLMYEALSPIVNQFAQAFGPKIQSLIKDVTDVFTVLSGNFTDAADAAKALSPRAMAIYQAIEQLRPAVQNAASSIASLGQFFLQLSPAIVGVTTAVLQFLNTNLGKGLIIFTGAIGVLTGAFGLLRATGLVPTIAAIYNFIAAMTAAQAKQFALWIAGLTRNMLGLRNAFRAARISAVLFTGALTALATAGISLVIAGIANAMLDVGDNARQAASDVAQLKKQLDGIAGAGDVAAAQAVLTTKQGVEQAANLQIAVRRRELEEAKKRRGATAGVGVALAEQNLRDAEDTYEKAVEERKAAEKTVSNAERVAGERATAALPPRQQVTLGGGEGAGAGKGGKGSKAAKEIRDISADRLELSKRLFAAQEAENQIAIVNLQTALSVLDAEENIEGVNERQRAILEALSKRRLDLKKIAEDEAEEQKRADEERLRRQEEINRAVQEYNALLIDAQEATGAISPNEAAQRRRDMEQSQIIERLQGVLSPGQIENLKLAFEAIPQVGSIGEVMVELKRDFEELTDPVNMLITSAQGIGDAFGDAFNSIITGASSARESLSRFFGNVGKMFADMATRMITQWMVMKAVGLIGSLFPGSSPATPGGGGGGGTGSVPFSTTLGDPNVFAGMYRTAGIPLTPYANGGVVTGPTMGLIGEGRFNEAVVPLPNGKSIPVDLGGGAGGDIATSIVVNVNNGQASSSMKGNQGNQLAKNIEGAVKEVIMRETRPGGIIYSSRQ